MTCAAFTPLTPAFALTLSTGDSYHLFEINRQLFFTSSPVPILYEGNWYRPANFKSLDSITTSEGSKIGNTSLSVSVSKKLPLSTLESVVGLDVCVGLWCNGAAALLYRGVVGALTYEGGFSASLEILSLAAIADKDVSTTISPTCTLTLGSERCGVNLGGFTVEGAVSTVINDRGRFQVTLTSPLSSAQQDVEYFVGGSVQWANQRDLGQANFVFFPSILGPSTLDITLLKPSWGRIQVGDIVRLTAGCDKLRSTCANKFSNVLNFLGAAELPTVSARLRGV